MTFDNELVAGKLRRWEKYLDDYRLPLWEEIPNFPYLFTEVLMAEMGTLQAEIDAATSGFLVRVAHGWASTHLDARLRAAEFFIGV